MLAQMQHAQLYRPAHCGRTRLNPTCGGPAPLRASPSQLQQRGSTAARFKVGQEEEQLLEQPVAQAATVAAPTAVTAGQSVRQPSTRPKGSRTPTPLITRPMFPLTTSSWDDHDHHDLPFGLEDLSSATGPPATTKAPQLQQTSVSQQAPLRADEAWEVFEAELEANLAITLTTLVSIVGVICFWRGVWSLLDFYLGDNPVGDLCCILGGFAIILYIRLSGLPVGSFWPR